MIGYFNLFNYLNKMNGLNLIDNKLLNEADEYIRQHRLIELFEVRVIKLMYYF